jgi:hypothetical protein
VLGHIIDIGPVEQRQVRRLCVRPGERGMEPLDGQLLIATGGGQEAHPRLRGRAGKLDGVSEDGARPPRASRPVEAHRARQNRRRRSSHVAHPGSYPDRRGWIMPRMSGLDLAVGQPSSLTARMAVIIARHPSVLMAKIGLASPSLVSRMATVLPQCMTSTQFLVASSGL